MLLFFLLKVESLSKCEMGFWEFLFLNFFEGVGTGVFEQCEMGEMEICGEEEIMEMGILRFEEREV